MLNEKGKRKLEFRGEIYYWYIKVGSVGFPQIHIMSADKKLQLKYGFDKELSISARYIQILLDNYFKNNNTQ